MRLRSISHLGLPFFALLALAASGCGEDTRSVSVPEFGDDTLATDVNGNDPADPEGDPANDVGNAGEDTNDIGGNSGEQIGDATDPDTGSGDEGATDAVNGTGADDTSSSGADSSESGSENETPPADEGPAADEGTATEEDTATEAPVEPEAPAVSEVPWGLVENPSASCSVPEMPSFQSLTPNPNLPDPFTRMDGTRITDRSEWVCRREELREQLLNFVWGEKPIPQDVSGTVSTQSITVNVNDRGGSTQFSVSVNMNGATMPAPAIISYSGPLQVPNGVAAIGFQAIEQTGGAGAKTGPFYDVYGANHPAGYLTAQAWQVSRILDVLEQNPGIIDPTRVGVTGCSRNGKGAFVAGALDNRIALTIPVESGLGGTVGLRLVEQVGGGEWPYHGISYVRWMSEAALGQFTSGNNAGADNTDRLPVDMHEMMALIAPRGLYISDNPSTNYAGLDREAAWITGNVGKMIFEALGVGDHFSYDGNSGTHCSNFRGGQLNAMIDKFLRGNENAATGNVATDFNGPNPNDHIDWEVPTLTGEL